MANIGTSLHYLKAGKAKPHHEHYPLFENTVHSIAMCLFKIYEYHKLSADATVLNTK